MTLRSTSNCLGALLASLVGLVSLPAWTQNAAPPAPAPPASAEIGSDANCTKSPTPTNCIVQLSLHSNGGQWTAEIAYYYTGKPERAEFSMHMVVNAATAPLERISIVKVTAPVEIGLHHLSVPLEHPGIFPVMTKNVTATMRANGYPLSTAWTKTSIDWPTVADYIRRIKPGQEGNEMMVARAVQLIDNENSDDRIQAKTLLEQVVAIDPRFDAAYVELARVAMKSSWGPEGIHQAEVLLESALQIAPQSVNAKILLGYVYTHQGRYAQAQSLFEAAAFANPPNLWLWANWGELLAAQGKPDQAIQKYRETLTRPRSLPTYDRARYEAFRQLLALYTKRNDMDGLEAVLKQRVAEFGPGTCASTDYARFLLQQRGDVAGAIKLSSEVVASTCPREAEARQVLGMSYYMAWTGATDDQNKSDALNRARAYLPAGALPLYLLASSERTAVAAKQLIAAGENIDQRDNSGDNALAHALQRDDLAAARRLLQMGAKPDALVGFDMPVALLAVMNENFEAIRLMQEFGANYAKLRFQGTTAFEVAKSSGNTKLLNALKLKPTTL